MSLFRASSRPSVTDPEELVRRYFESVAAGSEPDPLFRRRLRGAVMNQYVAAREGVVVELPRTRSAMGALGRACLVATVAVVMSVGSVMAASRAALPGDFLYPVKRELEALRVRLLPAEFHDDLALYALGQRINEVGRLAEAGNWDAVAALLPEIDAGYAMVADTAAREQGSAASVSIAPEMLEELVKGLPANAQAAIERVMDEAAGFNGGLPRGPHSPHADRQPEQRPLADPPKPARDGGGVPVVGSDAAEQPPPEPPSNAKPTHEAKEQSDGADGADPVAEAPDEREGEAEEADVEVEEESVGTD